MHDRIADNILQFGRALRRAGLPVGPHRILNAIDAVETVGLKSRDDLYWALHATMTRRREDHQLFDQAFRIFWRDPHLMEKMMALMLPEIAATPDRAREQASRRVSEALLTPRGRMPEIEEIEIDLDAQGTASSTELLRNKDFEQMSAAEIAEAKAAIQRFPLDTDMAPTRRFERSARGRIDLRATLRGSLHTPDLIELKRRRQTRHPAPLVILCDISGSMSAYTRIFLHFMHLLTNRRERTHCFLFGTRLTNISHALKHRDIDEALARVSRLVPDWDGGTRIGETLHRFNVDWARRVLGQGAVLLLVTDGLDREGGAGVEPEIARLHRLTRRLVWANPLLRYDGFEPRSQGIRALLPHVDDFRPMHSLNSLEDLLVALSGNLPLPEPRPIA